MKKSSKIILGVCFHGFMLTVIAGALVFWWGLEEFQKPGPLKEKIIVEVERGSGLDAIAWKLTDAGAVDNPYIFIFGTRLAGAQGELKAGEYEILPGMSARDIMAVIRDGKIFARRVTIPEGLTSYAIENIVSQIKDIAIVRVEIPAEGTLLPETYDYKKTDTNADILNRMTAARIKTLDELWEGRTENLPVGTKEEALVLASVVEKETGMAAERNRVAGVFVNRLRQGIPLQSDPTVIYAITGGKPKNDGHGPLGRRLLSKDLQFESPYNTYLHPGLPPGPICNPGRASIEAVLHPEEHDFLYFVADGTGGHIFASTLAEHERNVSDWRKTRREQER